MLEIIASILGLASVVLWFWSLIAASRVSGWAILFSFLFFPFSTIIYAYLLDEPGFRKPANFAMLVFALQITLVAFYVNQETDDLHAFYTTIIADCAKAHAENSPYIDIKYLEEDALFEPTRPEVLISSASERAAFISCVQEGAKNYSELVQGLVLDNRNGEAMIMELSNVKQ